MGRILHMAQYCRKMRRKLCRKMRTGAISTACIQMIAQMRNRMV
jgi:hypothetical protein